MVILRLRLTGLRRSSVATTEQQADIGEHTSDLRHSQCAESSRNTEFSLFSLRAIRKNSNAGKVSVNRLFLLTRFFRATCVSFGRDGG